MAVGNLIIFRDFFSFLHKYNVFHRLLGDEDGLLAGRDLYSVTPDVTREFGFRSDIVY